MFILEMYDVLPSSTLGLTWNRYGDFIREILRMYLDKTFLD